MNLCIATSPESCSVIGRSKSLLLSFEIRPNPTGGTVSVKCDSAFTESKKALQAITELRLEFDKDSHCQERMIIGNDNCIIHIDLYQASEKSMTRITVGGQTLDVSMDAAITYVTGMIVSPLVIVAEVHWALSYCMPGRAIGDFLRLIQATVTQLQDASAILDDSRLLQMVNEVLPSLSGFVDAAQGIREWQTHNVPRRIRTAHNKAVQQFGPVDPPWSQVDEFIQRLHKLSAAFSGYLDALSHIIPVLQQILPPGTSPSLSEQLERALRQIPDFQNILSLGYTEMIRIKAIEMGHFPSA
jgi:hypothetical protein